MLYVHASITTIATSDVEFYASRQRNKIDAVLRRLTAVAWRM
ncbi:MAG: hypothetical protein U0531_06235 [Dehalococcoidia bacterium]